MTSTYVAGVFLTICTYEGPQLVYHYYDGSVASSFNDSDKSSDDEIEWSEDESEDYEDEGSLTNDNLSYLDSSYHGPRSIGSDVTGVWGRARSLQRSGSRSPSRSRSRSRQRVPIPAAKPDVNRLATISSRQYSPASSAGSSATNNSHKPESASHLTAAMASLSAAADPERNSVAGSAGDIAINSNNMSNSVSTHSDAFSNTTLRQAATNSGGNGSGGGSGNIHAERSSDADSASNIPLVEDRAILPCGLDRDILAEMLTPPESMCNEKFSVSVDDCIFIGIPVHILESGTWRPLRKEFVGNFNGEKEAVSSQLGSKIIDTGHESGEGDDDDDDDDDDDNDGKNDDDENRDNDDSKDNASSKRVSKALDEKSDADEDPKKSTQLQVPGVITEKDSPMRMFHVNFAIIPPITEAAVCEERVYRYILVPFVRMLRQEQASKNYVWNEVVKMQRACDALVHPTAAERQEAMESASELARALRQMCTTISKMEIARIIIGNKARAFQVPLQLELSQLPSTLDEVSPHAYVSTTNHPDKEICHDCYECYGLLLLDDPEVIVQEIEVDPQGPVAAMIRNIDPTASLEELARHNNIEIKQIVNLVWSLVYWRRARIIIPVHARYTYGISPLSTLDAEFYELARTYHELFPMMPPMQKLMALLSTGKPKPFSMHIPSTDHRNIYLRTISWMLQKDLVVQLSTFALVVITRKIRISSLNNEEAMGDNNHHSHLRSKPTDNEEVGNASDDPFINDTSTDRFKRRRWMSRRKSSSRIEIEEIEDLVIQDARNVTPLEKKYLGQVAVAGLTRNPELAAMFQRLTKYFNGKDCLEQVMIRERISREEMRSFLHEFNQYIVTYKHW